MSKTKRQNVFDKYNGRCAYCGCELQKGWHVDHIEAHWHTYTLEQCEKFGIKKGADTIENMNPACARCNRWKSTFGIEDFRQEVQAQLDRLRLYNANYRLALDYGMVSENRSPVKFHFETISN